MVDVADPAACAISIKKFLALDLPIIAVQQWPQNPLIGHFRVVVGVTDESVIVHDPEQVKGGSVWPFANFLSAWQMTGINVASGAGLVIHRAPPQGSKPVDEIRAEIAAARAALGRA